MKMTKKISAALIAGLILMPMPVFAADENGNIHKLSFDKITEEMQVRSPLIVIAEERVEDASSDLRHMEDNLEESIDELDTAIDTFPSGGAPEALQQLYANKAILESQLRAVKDQKDDLWKSWIQLDQGKDQAVWGAQQIYLGYFGLSQTKDNLEANLVLAEEKLAAQQLSEALGLSTHVDTVVVENQLKELRLSIDILNKTLNSMIGQMNVMLGQDFDTELSFSEPSTLNQRELNDMDYDDDLVNALRQSYDVRLTNSIDERDNTKRNFTLAFHQAFQSVQDKKATLDLEYAKLDQEKIKYDQNTIMYSLGLVSSLDYEGLSSLYQTQGNKVRTAEQDLLKAYTAYKWMKQGLTVSTSTGS